MRKDVIRGALFYRFLAHYRLAVFREMQRDETISVAICAPEKQSGSFLLTEHSEVGFPFINIRTWQWRIPFTRRYLVFQPYAVWCMLTGKFDLFIMENTFLDIHVCINLVLSRLFGRPVCLWGHGDTQPSTVLSRALRRVIMRMAHAVIFYTEGDRDRWIALGLPARKLFVAHNAVDTDYISEMRARVTRQALAAFKQDWDLEGRSVVNYTGRLLAWKHPDVLIRAMHHVVQQVPEAYLMMIGDGPMRPELERLVTELGLSEHVRLTGRIIEEETVAKLHMCSRVAVMPGHAGLAVQHAFGYGVPIVVGDEMELHPPEVELVVQDHTGLYCRHDDPQDYARAICRLLTDDQERERMSANGLRVIEEQYNTRNMARGFLDTIRYCLRGRDPA